MSPAGGRARPLLIALIPGLVVALALRVWALAELSGTFLFDAVLLDHEYYWSWARDVARGKVAGDDTFEMDPGYAYWLGLWLALFGESLWVPRILNVGHGLVTCAACGLLAHQLAGHLDEKKRLALARASAVVCGLFPVVLYYDLLVMKTSMALAVLPLATWALLRARERASLASALVAGLAFAGACLVRGNLLPLLPVFAVAGAGLAGPRSWLPALRSSAFWRRAAALVVGAGLVLALPLAHNLAAGGTATVLHAGGGEVFYTGTFAEGGGEYVRLPFVRPHPRLEHQDFRDEAARRLGRELDRGESSRFWWRQGLQRIVDAPLRYLKLELNKALTLLSAFEHPDSASYYFFGGLVTPLGLLGWLHFGLLMPLTLAALVVLFRRRERGPSAVPLVVAAGYLGAFLLFFVYSRFRAPIIPLLIPYALLGLKAVFELRRASPRRALAYLGVLLLSAVVLNRSPPADPERELGRQYANYGAYYAARGQTEVARALLKRGIEAGDLDATAGLAAVELHEGRLPEAARLAEAVLREDPTQGRALEVYIAVLFQTGRREQAEQLLASPQAEHLEPEARARLDQARARAGAAPAP